MKVLLKYSALILVVLCLNSELTEAFNACHELSTTTQETQFIAHHTQNTRQAINHFYDHCLEMTCDIIHQHQDVPVAKSTTRHTQLEKTSIEQIARRKKPATISHHHFNDPVAYYVFELRKITV